ncbi:diacylglycerol/lipid kinase family protein [Aquisphaera giovannonii]|nr:diacylglycerol kinase family protein [Aquisphaera giovannonii]
MASEVETSRMFVVINVKSGNASPDEVRRAMREGWKGRPEDQWIWQPGEGEDIVEAVRLAAAEGYDTVVAAGGDGTVSAVAGALVGTKAKLAIIPLGTANVLARELGIPIEVQGASDLVNGPHEVDAIDAMAYRNKHYFTQIGVGLDALMIRDTKTEDKKRLGVLAYVWTAVKKAVGFQPHRFSVSVDGKTSRPKAVQVLLANCGALGTSGLRWGPDIAINDGRIDVLVLRAASLLSHLRVASNFVLGRHRQDPATSYQKAARVVAIQSERPLPVQGDGEVVGETPIEVQVVPRALRVVVPPKAG